MDMFSTQISFAAIVLKLWQLVKSAEFALRHRFGTSPSVTVRTALLTGSMIFKLSSASNADLDIFQSMVLVSAQHPPHTLIMTINAWDVLQINGGTLQVKSAKPASQTLFTIRNNLDVSALLLHLI